MKSQIELEYDLIIAVTRQKINETRRLLKLGTSPNLKSGPCTLIELACIRKNKSLVKLLLKYKAKITDSDFSFIKTQVTNDFILETMPEMLI